VSRRVPGRLVADYFGASRPDEATRRRWLCALFRDIFLNPGDRDPAVRDAVALAAANLSVWLDESIAGLIEATQYLCPSYCKPALNFLSFSHAVPVGAQRGLARV
jgi:hypothetical protein